MTDLSAAFERWVAEATDRQPWDFTSAELGVYSAGYAEGWDAAWWQINNWLGIARAGLSGPTQNELTKAREHTDEPCGRGRKNLDAKGKLDCDCSRCTRHVAAWIAQRDFGMPDYPGVVQATALRAAS